MLTRNLTIRKAIALVLAFALVLTLFIGAVPLDEQLTVDNGQLTVDNGQLTVEPTALAELGGYDYYEYIPDNEYGYAEPEAASAAFEPMFIDIAPLDNQDHIWSGAGSDITGLADGCVVTIQTGASGTLIIPANTTVTITGGTESAPVNTSGITLNRQAATSVVNWNAHVTRSAGGSTVTLSGAGTFNMTDGTIQRPTGSNPALDSTAGIANILGGTISAQGGTGIFANAGSIIVTSGVISSGTASAISGTSTSNVTINGGNISSTSFNAVHRAAGTGTLTINGGTFSAPAANVGVNVAGGSVVIGGNVTLPGVTVAAAGQMTVNNGATLTLTSNSTNNGTITNNGIITNNGTVTNNGTLTNDGTVTNNGTISTRPGGVVGTPVTGNPPAVQQQSPPTPTPPPTPPTLPTCTGDPATCQVPDCTDCAPPPPPPTCTGDPATCQVPGCTDCVTPPPPPPVTQDRDRDSNGNGGGGGNIITNIINGLFGGQQAPQTVTPAVANTAAQSAVTAAIAAGGTTATANIRNAGEITLAALQSMANSAVQAGVAMRLQADSMTPQGNAVDVRITINPAQATQALNLSGSTLNTRAMQTAGLFRQFFSNDVMSVALGQQGSFGQEVRIAARLAPGMGVGNLHFYAFDRTANTFRAIPAPEHWVDQNSFVHFNMPFAGSIVISDGALQRR